MKRAFTLIELLMVIAIIAILTAVLLSSLSASRNKARQATRSNNLEQINPGVHVYADDHDNVLTLVGMDYRSLMQRYVGLKGASLPQDTLFAVVGDF